MTDSLDDDISEENEKKKKGGDEDGEGHMREAEVSPEAIAYLLQVGASEKLIKKVMAAWRHYKGEGPVRRLIETLKSLVHSKHVEVEIDKTKNFNVVHDFVQESKKINDMNPHAAKLQHAQQHMQNMPEPQ